MTACTGKWPRKRLRFLTLRRQHKGVSLSSRSEISFLPMEAIGEQGQLDLATTIRLEDIKSGYSQFFDGDVVVAKITPCFENGKGALIGGTKNGVGFGTTELHVLRPSTELDGRFLYYVTVDPRFRLRGEACMTGTAGQQRVPEAYIRDYSVRVPPLTQQRAMADYLDRETSRIDALIGEKERVIGLLTEKRRALVSRTVTRGIDPNVSRRHSGIPWLGEIPLHWEVTRLKFVGTVQTGLALGKKYRSRTVIKYPYLRVANVQDGFLDLSDLKAVAIPEQEAGSYLLRAGDVLMNEGGDADKLGRGAVWTGEIDPCLHQNHVFAVRARDISSDWLAQWITSDHAKAYFESRSKQSTNLASISATNLMEMPLLRPPQAEQLAIVGAVQKGIRKIDAVSSETECTVKLLKERRGALIASAIAGQIDVEAAE